MNLKLRRYESKKERGEGLFPTFLPSHLRAYNIPTFMASTLPRCFRFHLAHVRRRPHARDRALACSSDDLHSAAGAVSRGEHSIEVHPLMLVDDQTAAVVGEPPRPEDELRDGR